MLSCSLLFGALLVSGCAMPVLGQAAPVIRLAEVEVDAAQVDAYRAALREEIEASVRLEPGVLMLYAVTVKDHPEQVRLFERYASQAAYESHRLSPHFLKYKAATKDMVRSLTLIEAEPLLLGSKSIPGSH